MFLLCLFAWILWLHTCYWSKEHCLIICDTLLLMIIEFVIINLRILIWLNRNNLCVRDITIDHKRYCSLSNRLFSICSTNIVNSGFLSFFKISSKRVYPGLSDENKVNDGDILCVTPVYLRSSLTMVHGEDSLQKISSLAVYSFPDRTLSGSYLFYLRCPLEPNNVYVSTIFNIEEQRSAVVDVFLCWTWSIAAQVQKL